MSNQNGATSPTQLLTNQLRVATSQLIRERMSSILGPTMYSDERDINGALGWPTNLTFSHFEGMYTRDRLAKRLVNLPANESWRKAPIIIDGDSKSRYTKEERESLIDLPQDTPFITGLKTVISQRRLWHYLNRVDRGAGIGRYGVLLIGCKQPAGTQLKDPVRPLLGPEDVIYLKPLTEEHAKIVESQLEDNPLSPRYGMPVNYDLDLGAGNVRTHYSRIIHVAENLLEDEINGEPRLEDAFNYLLSLLLVVGGTAEGTWRSAFKRLFMAIDPEADFDGSSGSDDVEALESTMEDFIHGFKSLMWSQGADRVDTVGGDPVDPTGIFDILISILSGDIPRSILLGAQAGALASSETDMKNWAGFIASRQTSFVEPTILRPVIDWLISNKALPQPAAGSYTVEWPALFEMSESQQAEIRLTNAQAQREEWDSAHLPSVTRWKITRGDDWEELQADYDESPEILDAGIEV